MVSGRANYFSPALLFQKLYYRVVRSSLMTLIDTVRTFIRRPSTLEVFGVDEEAVVVKQENDRLIYVITYGDREDNYAGYWKYRAGCEKELIQIELTNLDVGDSAEECILGLMTMDLHELTHWADEHHNFEEAVDDDHSTVWQKFFFDNIFRNV